MLAITLKKHGGPEALGITDQPKPVVGSHGVLIKIHCAGLNHLDLFVCQGWPGLKLNFPHILGSDAAGTIVEIAPKARRFLAPGLKLGSAVVVNSALPCGACEFCRAKQPALCVDLKIFGEHLPGTYAEFFVAPPTQLLPLPKHLTFEEGAAFPLTFVTAWRMLTTLAKLKKKETLLIQGIGGGVATAAMLLAKKLGATVMVSSRDPEKLKRAKMLGADQLLLATPTLAADVRQLTQKRGVDVVLDSVGKQTWEQSLTALSRGGRLVSCGATTGPAAVTDLNRLFWNQLTIFGSTMGSREEFKAMHRFVCKHKIHPHIDRIFPAGDAASALAYLESAKQMGKVVLKF